MATNELSSEQLQDLRNIFKKQSDVEEKIDTYSKKMLSPVFEERRELVKKIPQFWTDVIMGSGQFEDILSGEDQDLLEHLVDLYIEHGEDDDTKHFTVYMEFKENDQLEDLKISKKYTFKKDDPEEKKTEENEEDGLLSIPDMAEGVWKSEAVTLKWKKERDPKDAEFIPNFFNWLSYTGEKDDETDSAYADVGPILANDIFNNAVNYYIASQHPEVDPFTGVDSDEDSSSFDEAEEEDEQEEEDEDEKPPKKKSKK